VVQQSRQFSSWRRARQWSSRRAGLLRAIGRRDRVGRLDAGTLGDAVNHRAEMFRTLRSVNLQTAQSAYDWWMDQTAQRQQAPNGPSPRSTGHHPATGVDRAQLDLRRDLCLASARNTCWC
jgi:hypothetical protein